MYFTAQDFLENSPIRFNCIEWLGISPTDRVCILGDISTSMEKAFVDRGIFVSSVLDGAEFDYVILYHCDITQKLLRLCKDKLSVRGRMVLFQKNRYGATVLAGGDFDLSRLTNPHGIDTLEDMQTLLEASDISQYQTFYPYPDSKFMTTIFSDERIPKEGECNHNTRNIEQDRLVLLDEQKLYQKAIIEGGFPKISNEFIFVIGQNLPIEYVRYSNDRADQYQIKTEIATLDNHKVVYKKALNTSAELHLQQMALAYEKLVNKYEKPGLEFVPCTLQSDAVVAFPFVEGESLADYMTLLLKDEKKQEVLDLFKQFIALIEHETTQEISNRDFIFSNILIGDTTWHVIDYEWIEMKHVPTQELAFRAAYCYYLEQSDFPFIEAIELLEISLNRVRELMEQEVLFQKSVTEGALSFAAFRENLGVKAYTTDDIRRAFLLKEPEKKVQLYYDFGTGFSENESEFLYKCLEAPHEMKVQISIPDGCKVIRIDPCESACIVKIKQVLLEDRIEQFGKYIQINGAKCESRLSKKSIGYPEYIFDTEDPNIVITLPCEEIRKNRKLEVNMEIHEISMEMATNLCKQIRKII